jgi:hypothetical protein
MRERCPAMPRVDTRLLADVQANIPSILRRCCHAISGCFHRHYQIYFECCCTGNPMILLTNNISMLKLLNSHNSQAWFRSWSLCQCTFISMQHIVYALFMSTHDISVQYILLWSAVIPCKCSQWRIPLQYIRFIWDYLAYRSPRRHLPRKIYFP